MLVGNDIVDISTEHANLTWSNHRWANKVFSRSEQDIIYADPNPKEKFWIAWAMKESAYKLIQKSQNNPFFNFKNIKINFEFNQCEFNHQIFPMTISLENELVHVSSQTSKAIKAIRKVQELTNFDKSAIQKEIVQTFSIPWSISYLSYGAPTLNSKIADISFSYDGKWASYFIAISEKSVTN